MLTWNERRRPWPSLMLASLAVACAGDAVCVGHQCQVLYAANISVTAPNAPMGVAGLTMVVNGTAQDDCRPGVGGVVVCFVAGGRGAYSVDLAAPGYQIVNVKFTATGSVGAHCQCDAVDTQMLSVVLQPV